MDSQREIKFRARATCSDRWAYGSYVECDGGYYIIEKLGGDSVSVAKIQVWPKSVGQAIGLKDKKGKGKKEVYEGDIVLCSYLETASPIFKGIITYAPPEFYLACFWESVEGEESSYKVGVNNRSLCRNLWRVDEIIGTIHTHPELMEKP